MSVAPILILGGRSEIGLAIARRFAAAGHPVQLAARNAARLADDSADLSLRYGTAVDLFECDLLDTTATEAMIAGLDPLPGIAVCAVGLLGDQAEGERNAAAAIAVMRSNFEAPAMAMGFLANRFAARGSGVLVGISSVAGERGRASNYIYGASKAGFTAYLSGLRSRLAGQGVQVVTVLPGFVATRMVAGRDLPPRLTATPDKVAQAVMRAVARRQNVIHVRRIWGPIMWVIRALPEAVFLRTRF